MYREVLYKYCCLDYQQVTKPKTVTRISRILTAKDGNTHTKELCEQWIKTNLAAYIRKECDEFAPLMHEQTIVNCKN